MVLLLCASCGFFVFDAAYHRFSHQPLSLAALKKKHAIAASRPSSSTNLRQANVSPTISSLAGEYGKDAGTQGILETFGNAGKEELDDWDNELPTEDVRLLANFRSRHNFVRVLEVARHADHPVAGARVLLLDRPGNIQSIYDPFKVLTSSYYDVFASLPPLLPCGPIGIYGLGAGTTARLLLHFWPGLDIHGWEIDPAVITVARKYFDLSELEEGKVLPNNNHPAFGTSGGEATKNQGTLLVHVGDALGSNAMLPEGFAGIFVDLFVEGAAISALQDPDTWRSLKDRLLVGGRIMVNCGGSCVEAEGVRRKDGREIMEATLNAMMKVFPGEIIKRNVGKPGDSIVALTGPVPDLKRWRAALPDSLRAVEARVPSLGFGEISVDQC